MVLPVLITLIPLNLEVELPWETALTWEGCPLPSKKEPNNR